MPVRRALNRVLVILFAAHGLVLAIIFYTPLSTWLIRPLVVGPDLRKSDCIVVLAAWASVRGELNEPGLNRVLEASRLYKRGLAPLVLVSGAPDGVDPGAGDSALVMKGILQELGVPESAILLEHKAENTYESAVNVAAIARERHWSRVLLVSDAKHMKRALAVFRRQRLDAAPAPSMEWEVYSAWPSQRLLQVQAAVHEYLGLLYYDWRGWI